MKDGTLTGMSRYPAMTQEKKHPHLRVVRPEDEDRRTDPAVVPFSTGLANGPAIKRPGDARNAAGDAKSSRVESLPDGEPAAAEEASKARDD
jgi:hypothetical protein